MYDTRIIYRGNTVKRTQLAALLVLVSVARLFGQPYYIQSTTYESIGRSREYLLALKADIRTGVQFKDRSALDAYLADKRQILLNERVLDSVQIAAMEHAAGPDGRTPVSLTVKTIDTWNIVALPYFKYDSNEGLLLSIRARDYNFLGTMEPLRINFNLEEDLAGHAFWGADADFSYPFPAFGLDWAWILGGAFAIEGLDSPVRSSIETALKAALPLGPGSLELKTGQTAWFNRLDSQGEPYSDPFYLRSAASAGWRLPVTIPFLPLQAAVRPRVELGFNWLPGGLSDAELDRGPTSTAGLGLSYGRADWIGNFRRGMTLSSDAALDYYLLEQDWAGAFSFTGTLFLDLGWAGPSARFYALKVLGDTTENAGAAVRGVLNSRAETDAALSLNLDLPIRLIRFVPYEWFDKGWMKLFQFEQHWSPFLDASIGNYDGEFFDLTKGWYGAGLEVITFPLIMRSFYVRISVGWSVPDVLELGNLSGKSQRDNKGINEVFIGLGHHY